MNQNRHKSAFDSGNRSSKELEVEVDQKKAYQRDLVYQIAERKPQNLNKKKDEKEEENLQRQFHEMQLAMATHIKKQEEKVRSTTSKKDSLVDVLNSKVNCINTDLSKNYVLKHKKTSDYNTLTDTSDIKPDLIRNDSGKQMRLRQLKSKLQDVKQKAFETLESKEKSEAKLFELKSQLKRMQMDKERYMTKLKAAINRNNADEISNVFLCETDFIPINVQQSIKEITNDEKTRHSLYGRPTYRINSGGRKWSTRGTSKKCEEEIKDLQGLLDNYYKS